MARTLPRQRRGTVRCGLGRMSRPARGVLRMAAKAPEKRVRTRRKARSRGALESSMPPHMDWSEITAGAAGAGGSVVGAAAAALMVAVALNGPPAWRAVTVEPPQRRPLLMRPQLRERVRHR